MKRIKLAVGEDSAAYNTGANTQLQADKKSVEDSRGQIEDRCLPDWDNGRNPMCRCEQCRDRAKRRADQIIKLICSE